MAMEDQAQPDSEMPKRATTRTADRTLQLFLQVVESGAPQSLSALARAVELSPSTAFRLLSTLSSHGLVDRSEEGAYTVGARMKQFAVASLHSDPLYDLSGVHLEEIAELSRESASLGTPIGLTEVLYLRQVGSPSQVVQAVGWVGRTIPRYDTALGFALDGKVSAEGYSISRREDNEVDAVAVPVFSQRALIVGALSVSAPRYRTTIEDLHRYGRLLLGHGEQLSEELGARLDVLRERGYYRH